MSSTPRVNRDDLRRIYNNDLRLIKAFESIINNQPNQQSDTTIDLGSVTAKTNQAIGQTVRNETRAKGNSVLLWLSTV